MPPRPRRPAVAAATSTRASEAVPGASPASRSKPKPRPEPTSPGERLGLRSDWDYALHLPLHYIDETRLTAIAALREGHAAVVQARVVLAEVAGGVRKQLRVQVEDASGQLELRFFHFYANWARQYAVGKLLRIRGEPRAGLFGMEMVHPTCHVARADEPMPDRLTPIYPAAAGISQAWLRKAIASARARLDAHEWLPAALLAQRQLPDIASTLDMLHAPTPEVSLATLQDRSHPAWQRVKFDELLAQQLAQQQARARRATLRAWPMAAQRGSQSLTRRLLEVLPFTLTPDQQSCVAEIAADLRREQPMHRLLQGDVGSGKTVVAALAATQAIDAGFQCALMAPTDILASQHLRKLADWLAPLGVQVAWLSGAQARRERAAALAAASSGTSQLVVGTHAVIQDKVNFARLGLAIVDEQHRFGVAQRLSLRAKGGEGTQEPSAARSGQPVREPHLLMMSATPIPRTLAMAVFGDLDVSTIAHLPPGRSPVQTRVFSDARRDAVIARVRELLAAGRQVYWVCPLVEDSEVLDLRNAEATYAELQVALSGDGARGEGEDARVGLLHGRMPAAQKAQVMADFACARLRLLVATTVIEVGVDVPAATLMVIEHAERFGLSQLHQLRGRVGRGAEASECLLLFSAPLSDLARARLQALRDSGDGFVLAQKDLELRGPGELLGQRQSGLQALRHADLQTDTALLDAAREAAIWLLRHDPPAARQHLQRWLGGRLDWLAA
ncbi:MAG: ATP-dependent DNA helicase RecG [Burkholderiales bacterium]|nr:ATP-dependent DNA helicase RecG [Burkholderiales bacterium]